MNYLPFCSILYRGSIMKFFEKKKQKDKIFKQIPKNFKKKLNLNYLDITNLTYPVGKYGLPALVCDINVYPDYIAQYNNPKDYHKTNNTAVAFYLFDDIFDGKDGLYNAIYFNDKKLLNEFKKRFKGVKFFISPDYSQLGDIDLIENLHRLKKSRIVSLWLMHEFHVPVIPHITFPTLDVLDIYLSGLEDCNVVAFSTMGIINYSYEKKILQEAIKYTVDYLKKLKTIIVFDVCAEDDNVNDIFSYAIEKGINIVIPANKLKIRNKINKNVRREQRRLKCEEQTVNKQMELSLRLN